MAQFEKDFEDAGEGIVNCQQGIAGKNERAGLEELTCDACERNLMQSAQKHSEDLRSAGM